VPIIYFSVKWWNTLHQGASVSLTAGAEDGHHHADQAMLIMTAGILGLRLRRRLHARPRHHPGTRARHTAWVTIC
jgi:heme exporter protein C